ncbi:PDDEXK-like family protein [Bifidobacterium cebidarum]|nr:PD-(D/E)XK nuclease family protein [Bifidobacterium cebidarum]
MSEPVKTIEPVSLAMSMLSDPDFLEANSLLHKPNMFDMVGMSRQEIRHSAFLAWLLEPSNPHGLDDLLIRRLLAELYKAHPEGFATFAVKDLSDLVVEREVTTGEGRNRIDVLCYDSNERLALCIENKVDSQLHDRQLDKYYDYVENTYSDWCRVYVLLSPGGEPAPEKECKNPDKWIPISYETIARILEDLVPYAESKTGSVINDYIRMLKKETIVEDKELDELAKNLYSKYGPVFDMVYARYVGDDSLDGELRSIYIKVLNEYNKYKNEDVFSWCHGENEPGRYLGFTTKRMDKYLLNKQEQRGSWGDNSRTYTYWIYPPLNNPSVKLELGPLNQSEDVIERMNRLVEVIPHKLQTVLPTNRYRKIITIPTNIGSLKYEDKTDVNPQAVENKLRTAIDKMLSKEKEYLDKLEH